MEIKDKLKMFINDLANTLYLKGIPVIYILIIIACKYYLEQNSKTENYAKLNFDEELLSENINLEFISNNLDINLQISTLNYEEKLYLVSLFLDLYTSKSRKIIFTDKKIVNMLANPEFEFNYSTKIYNPCSSVGEILCGLLQNKMVYHKNFYFSEINTEYTYILKLIYFILTSEKLEQSHLISENSFSQRFDYILANPPFTSVPINQDEISDPLIKKFKKYFSFHLLYKAKKLLNKNGKISIIVPDGLLYKKDFRVWLNDNYKIEKIISLSQSAFKPYANVKTSILFLKNEVCQNSYYFDYIKEDELENS